MRRDVAATSGYIVEFLLLAPIAVAAAGTWGYQNSAILVLCS